MKRIAFYTAAAAVALALTATSCKQDLDIVEEGTPTANGQVLPANLKVAPGLYRANQTLPVTPDDEDGGIVVDYDYENNVPGVKIKRTTFHHTGVAYNEFMVFNPAMNLVFPGNIFLGNTVSTGEYKPVKGQKVIPLTLVNDLIPERGGQLYSRVVTDITRGKYEDVRKDWLQYGAQEPAAVTEFEFERVDLNKDGKFSVASSMGDGSWKLSGSLTHTWERYKTHVLIKLTQKLYTISVEQPNGQILANAGSVDLQGAVPVYVSDVYYGRMAYALVSSNHTYDEVTTALGLLIPSWANLDVEIKSEYRKTLNESYLHQLSIGGTATQQGSFAKDGWEGFRESLAAPIPLSSAAPISFALKFVDDNSAASIYLTDRFPVVESHFVPESNELKFSFWPKRLRGKAVGKKDIFVYGNTVAELPDGSKVTLFDADQSNFYRMSESDVLTDIDAEIKQLVIRRPSGMSMTDFMELPVTITTQLYNTNATGTIKGDDLGKTVITRKVKDLIFDANQQNVEVSTQRNHPAEYTGGIVFQIGWDQSK